MDYALNLILRVSGSVPAGLPLPSPMKKKNWTKDPSPASPESSEVRIQGEELKSRIMGFGSGG